MMIEKKTPKLKASLKSIKVQALFWSGSYERNQSAQKSSRSQSDPFQKIAAHYGIAFLSLSKLTSWITWRLGGWPLPPLQGLMLDTAVGISTAKPRLRHGQNRRHCNQR